MFDTGKKKWYALFVSTGQEDKVKERLQYKFEPDCLRALVPKRKLRERKNGVWDTKIRTLFPGYVLLNGYIGDEDYHHIKDIPGIIKILTYNSHPAEIDIGEIQVISQLICDSEIISTSSVYADGGRIIVIDGPLLGMDGLIESIDKRKGRAKVRLNFIGESRLVELSIAVVQPA